MELSASLPEVRPGKGQRHLTTAITERSGVMGSVRRLLESAAHGHGGALFIVGEAGIGKTTMVEYALTLAEGRFRIGVGRGDRVEAVLPFGLIGQALDPLFGSGPHDSATDVPAEMRFYEILRRVREAAGEPLLLAFDDLHWADPDSRNAVHLLCRRLVPLPLAVIATARPWPAEALESAQELGSQGVASVQRLDPLSPAAAREVLLADIPRPLADSVVEHALGLCGGNPLLLHHLAAELRRRGELSGARTVFPMVRFAALAELEQRYLQAASVLGNRFRAVTAEEISGLSPDDTHRVLPGLFKSGLLRDGGEGWTDFAHDLVRQAVYEDLAPPLRRRLHEAAFRALVRGGASPAEAAEHAITAWLDGDPEAVATLAGAGREALQAGAVRTARRQLDAASELAGDSAPPDLLLDLGRALIADGAAEAAIGVHERLLRRSQLADVTRIAALGQLARAAFTSGQVQRAETCFETAVDLARPSHPDLALRALLDHAFLRLTDGPRAPLPLLERARLLATRASVPAGACAEAAWGMCAYLCGDRRGLAAAEDAAKHARFTPTSAAIGMHWAWDPVIIHAQLCTWTERFDEAERLFREVLEGAERRGEPMLIVQASFTWMDCLCRQGRLEAALAVSDRVMELADLVPFVLPLSTVYRAMVLVQAGRLEEARSWLDRLESLPAGGRRLHLVEGIGLQLRGTIALSTGDFALACQYFAELEQKTVAWGLLDPCQIPWAWSAIEAYLAGGRETDAGRVVAALESQASPAASRWPSLVAAAGRAAMADRSGDTSLAEEKFTWALGVETGMPLARVQALIAYGAFLNRSGASSRARPLLTEAVRIAEECGANAHADRARAEWRRAGGRRRARGPDELSPQEAAVARLARAGRSNREIAQQLHLSVNTVQTHLAHVYGKLGIHRRWELAALNDL